MTAIVGLVHQGTVHLGGDSAGVAGYSLTVRADVKVFTNGPYAMGFTSSFRMGQLLRYSFTPPAPMGQSVEKWDDVPKFMATHFIDAVRETLKTGGWLKKDSEREDGGTFLVGVCGHLFRIDSDFQVGEAADGYAAVGCGDEIALGALYATAKSRMAPHRRVRLALEAAERFSAGVRGPFALVEATS
ncbi:hypothetical protein ABZ890_11945 [Streptomyces sp. NPDC046984]|uniref:hypothetical protein n=1 Tax=Streptomyces sp. NPDC046984 TaxID=3155138 RepID=UPI003409DF54